jgi:hypothetical protein
LCRNASETVLQIRILWLGESSAAGRDARVAQMAREFLQNWLRGKGFPRKASAQYVLRGAVASHPVSLWMLGACEPGASGVDTCGGGTWAAVRRHICLLFCGFRALWWAPQDCRLIANGLRCLGEARSERLTASRPARATSQNAAAARPRVSEVLCRPR